MSSTPTQSPPLLRKKAAASAEAGNHASAEKRRPRSTKSAITKKAHAVVPAVIERAQQMGLLAETQQVGARLPTKLLKQARKRTGISSTTDLLTFALANVAIEDDFAKAFAAARGKLDPDLDIGF